VFGCLPAALPAFGTFDKLPGCPGWTLSAGSLQRDDRAETGNVIFCASTSNAQAGE